MENGRVTARMNKEFVVFLIGMRINRWWRPDLWLPVAMAMPRMLRELAAHPESGFLGIEYGGLANPALMVQYWESAEHLERYARAKDKAHFPAWVDFRKRLARSDAVGIWHETYVVQPGSYENVYVNMPRFGLGKIGDLVPAQGPHATARGRLAT